MESLRSEMMLLVKEFHRLYILKNQEIDKKIGEFFKLISFEIKNRPEWMKNIEDMTPAKIGEEKSRLVKFMFETSRIHGEIIQELDSVLYNYSYED